MFRVETSTHSGCYCTTDPWYVKIINKLLAGKYADLVFLLWKKNSFGNHFEGSHSPKWSAFLHFISNVVWRLRDWVKKIFILKIEDDIHHSVFFTRSECAIKKRILKTCAEKITFSMLIAQLAQKNFRKLKNLYACWVYANKFYACWVRVLQMG